MSQVQQEMDEAEDDRRKPTMTSDQRKSKYRDLLDKVEILHENEETGLETANALNQIIDNANILFKDTSNKERIKHTDEVLLDAKVVGKASDVLLFITEAVDCSLDTYEHIELGRRINSQLLDNCEDPDETDYTELTKIAQGILKIPPLYSFLYGELGNPKVQEKPVKKTKPRSQRNRNEVYAKRKQPEKVTEVNKEEDSVDDTVKFLQWALNKECDDSGKKQLNYFQFVIDPSSFSATIENMFHCSFLVRDGRAKLDYDKAGVIHISPVSSNDSKKAKKHGAKYKQSILSIDTEDWQALIQTLNIKKSFLTKWKSKWESRKKEMSL